MKILQVIASLTPGCGGPTNALRSLSFALAKKGQEVTIFTTDADIKGRLEVPLQTLINIRDVKFFYFPVQYLRYYKFSLPLLEALRRDIPHFDIVHIHSIFLFPTLVTAHYCRKYHKPYIIRTVGQLDPFFLRRHRFRKFLYLWLFERKNLEKAYALHFTTEEEKNWMRHLGYTFNDIVIPMGIDLREFNDLPAYGVFRFKYPELKDKKIILFLSRITFKKGLDILIRAFANLARERNDVHLVMAGPDNEGYGKKVKNWLRNEGILNRATFTGMLLGKDKLAAFRDSDVFVLPSYSENFGMAVIEAMACGVPVVISNKVGIYKKVQENNAGIVIECNGINLYQAIKSILDNETFAKELSINGKKTVEECYDIDKVADKLIEVYERMWTS